MNHNIPIFAVLDDRVIIQQDTPEEISAGGILIPEEAQQKQTIGTVVAVGPGEFYDYYDFAGLTADYQTRRKPMNARVGDRVVYTKWAGGDITLPDKTVYQIMRDKDVIAILSRVADDIKAELYGVV